MHRATFGIPIVRRRAILREEEPGRWSKSSSLRYLHFVLDDVTIARKKNEVGPTRFHGIIQLLTEMRAFFHWENRLRSTFSKDGVRGSLHLAAANAISALLSSGARATDPRNCARNARRDKENIGRTAEKLWRFLPVTILAETFLFDTEKLSTSVNPQIIVLRSIVVRNIRETPIVLQLLKNILVFVF